MTAQRQPALNFIEGTGVTIDVVDNPTLDDGATDVTISASGGGGGGTISFDYTFDSTTTDSDPGTGKLRLDNATQGSATKVRIDLLDRHSKDWTTVIDSFDDSSSSSVRGYLRISDAADSTKWILFAVSAVDSSSGYRNVTVTFVAQSGSNPLTNGNNVSVSFDRTGDRGAAGPVSIDYTFSTTTTNSDPGAGNLRLDNATQNISTHIRADLLDVAGADWTTILDSLDDPTSTVKGTIRLYLTRDPTKFLIFTVAAVDSSSGYRNVTVACTGYSTSSPFSNGDRVTLTYSRTGDKGDTGATPVRKLVMSWGGIVPIANGRGQAWMVPYDSDGSSLAFQITSVYARMEATYGADQSFQVQKAAGGDVQFTSPTTVATVTVTAGHYQATPATGLAFSVNSGDLVAVYFSAAGADVPFAVQLVGTA